MKFLKTFIFLLLIPFVAIAQTPQERGLEISQQAYDSDLGFHDTTAQMKMTLKNKQGDTSIRYIRNRTLEVTGDGNKSISIFDKPADVKGTAFLTWSHGLEPDQQWMYLPALKRVKRISSKNKSGPFMGSEFAYEDISSQEVEKYTYEYKGDEKINGIECYKIVRIPAYKYSGYKKSIVWIDKKRLVAIKIVYHDRKDSLLKTLTADGYKQYANKHWRPAKMTMINHQSGKSTVLEWSDYKFKTGLTDNDFRKNILKRIR
ncbi:MAG: outer membrane lipoprotein-sorting protein [Gammaproteobacteria bacterium]|nr:MAG: outer membrane lipoprotein-sorting protein [Gammaproteobacteria bacterium]